MEREAKNKVVVVTGGASGLGYEIANHFLKEHAKVVILVDINKEQGLRAVEQLNNEHGEGKAVFYKADVTKDLAEVSGKILKEYKQVDVLVNSAGILDDYNLRKTIGINVIALVEWSMKFFEHMRTDMNGKGGTIINVASLICFTDLALYIFYKASKCSVLGFTTSLGHEMNYEKFGVRTLTICPGSTNSNLKNVYKVWEEHKEEMKVHNASLIIQEAADVGLRTLEAFAKGETGTAWKIVGGILEEHKSVPILL